MTITTTLAAIRAARPCTDGWTKLLKHLGKAGPDDEPLDLLTVSDSNGLDDALWVLDNVISDRQIARLFAADCAERVCHLFAAIYPDDDRPTAAIRVARDPNSTDAQLAAAWAAAWAAAGAAARAAAWDAARAAGTARAAAWDAARAAQTARLRQYLTVGEAAAALPWPDEVAR